MAEYVCIRKCYHRGRLFQVGDPYTPGGDEKEVPHHFAKKGTPIPQPETPRLGAKVAGVGKPLPSLKSPGKSDFEGGGVADRDAPGVKPKKSI